MTAELAVATSEDLAFAVDSIEAANKALADAWASARRAGREDVGKPLIAIMAALQLNLRRFVQARDDAQEAEGRDPADWYLQDDSQPDYGPVYPPRGGWTHSDRVALSMN